jgi:hypothetical protein
MELDAVKSSYRRWAPIYDSTFGRITQMGRHRAVEAVNAGRGPGARGWHWHRAVAVALRAASRGDRHRLFRGHACACAPARRGRGAGPCARAAADGCAGAGFPGRAFRYRGGDVSGLGRARARARDGRDRTRVQTRRAGDHRQPFRPRKGAAGLDRARLRTACRPAGMAPRLSAPARIMGETSLSVAEERRLAPLGLFTYLRLEKS